MSSPRLDIDVLVVGTGPSGLITALTLAKNGVSVRVIEKLPNHPEGQRGAGIMHFLGVLDDVKKFGSPVMDYQDWKDGKRTKSYPIMPILEATPAFPERRVWVLGQDMTCSIFRQHLKAYGIEVELATELVRLDQEDEYVTAGVIRRKNGEEVEETITAKYVVGADGAKGMVRKLLGLTFLGETRDVLHFIIGDVEVHGVNKEYWHKFDDAPNDSVLLRPTDRVKKDNIYALLAFGPNFDHERALNDHQYLRQFVYSVAKVPELKIGKLECIADYRPSIRVTNGFRKGRVFVAGDAGHVHSATGGQGANSGVMDAFNLGWKLALASKGLASPGLLDSYDAERLPVIKEMLQRTTSILDRTFADRNGAPRAPAFDKEVTPSPWQRASQYNQLGVNYRWSPIVVDETNGELNGKNKDKAEELTANTYVVEEGGRLHAGDRAPDAPGLVDTETGSVRRLFDVFGPDHHTVLIFSDSQVTPVSDVVAHFPSGLIRTVMIRQHDAKASETAGAADLVLQDREGYAYAAYGPTRVVVARPDGVVGALAGGAEGVQKYFSGIFAL
ncbi:FAD/NAD(P)-binding domain-containing protein [Dentipellis sp. KUC8613]|nr:FAD/NAD(P)-binding domain-containing protein [Dentipellis sp. KUC8613]